MKKIIFILVVLMLSCFTEAGELLRDDFDSYGPEYNDSNEKTWILDEPSSYSTLDITEESSELSIALGSDDGHRSAVLIWDAAVQGAVSLSNGVTAQMTLTGLSIDEFGTPVTWDGQTFYGVSQLGIADSDNPTDRISAYRAPYAAIQINIRALDPNAMGSDYGYTVDASRGESSSVSVRQGLLPWDGNSALTVQLYVDNNGDDFAISIKDSENHIENLTFKLSDFSGALLFGTSVNPWFGLQQIMTNTLTATFDDVVVYDGFNIIQGNLFDDFEGYADNSELQSVWTAENAGLSLETVNIHAGQQAARAVFTSSGSVSKIFSEAVPSDDFDCKQISLWVKGDVGNVVLKAVDANDTVITSGNIIAVADEWTEVAAPVDANMTTIQGVVVDVETSGTLYFDDLALLVQPPPPAQLVVRWKLDEESGLIAADSSGNGINGVLSGLFDGSEWSFVDGRRCLQFGTDPNYNIIADDFSLPPTVNNIFDKDSGWSINFWVYFNELPNITSVLVGFGDVYMSTGNGSARYAATDGDNHIVARGMNSPYFHTGNRSFYAGKWHMATITYDARLSIQTIRMYIDGINAGTTTSVIWPLDAEMIFAISPRNYEPTPDMYFSDFSVWDQALTLSDIITLWGKDWHCLPENTGPMDFNQDCMVNFKDFAVFGQSWLYDIGVYFN